MIQSDVEVAVEANARLGEGPIWDPGASCLYFVDILAGKVHRFDPAAASSTEFAIGQSVGAVALTERDDLVLAVRDGFARLDLRTGAVRMIALVEADRPDHRMNDGACDPIGNFWAGTMALDERPGAGSLYRLNRDNSVDTMLTPVTISNGLDWSDDSRTMYFVDSPTRSVDLFDFDPETGALSSRRPLVRIAREDGMPDGLTLDAEGCVWVALWGGGAVRRYGPDGRLDAVVRLPVTHPTSCAFGGPDFRDLYITSAAGHASDDERRRQPHAGAVFRCRPGPAGRPPLRVRTAFERG